MESYVAAYQEAYEHQYNDSFLNGEYDFPISHYAILAMKEFEAIENIKITDIRHVVDQDEINYTYHKSNINFKKKNLESLVIPEKKYVLNNLFSELIFTIEITTNLNRKVIEKRLLIPEEDDEGQFLINSKRSKAIAQIVDANTYSQRGKITMKSRMPMICYRIKNRCIANYQGEELPANSYSYALDIKVRKNSTKKRTKFINPLMLFSAKMGLTKSIEFFGYSDIIKIVDKIKNTTFYDYYPIDELYVRVPRMALEEERVRNFICMIQYLYAKDFPITMENMNDTHYWICRIGLIGSIKDKNLNIFEGKGITTLYMIERLMDNITKNHSLRLPEIYKYNVYYVLRWMVENFEVLKAKSNMNLENKRIRKNEAIVQSSLGKKISLNINKLIENKNKSRLNDMESLCELFNFNSDIIMSGMRCLNDIVKSDDIVNDMTFLMDIAFTFKGYQSMGEKSGKRIANKYKDIDKSFMGRIDPNSTSNSDPGMSGHFTPFLQLYDRFFFSPNEDPHEGHYEAEKINFMYSHSIDPETGEVLTEALSMEGGIRFESFEKYMEWANKNDSFIDDLKYLPIVIVEKEVDNNKDDGIKALDYEMKVDGDNYTISEVNEEEEKNE